MTQDQADAALPAVEAITAEGWEVGSIDDAGAADDDAASTYNPAECDLSASTDFGDVALVPEGEEAVAASKAEFKKSGDEMFDLHGATVELKSYESEVDSDKLEAFAEKLKDCANFTITDDQGITSAVQILPVSLPNYADSTLAFKLQASVSFLIVIADIAVVASGHNVVTIAQVGLGGIDPQVVSELASATMANLETATQ